MNVLVALVGVGILVGIAWLGTGVAHLDTFFGGILPCIAFVLFIVGVIVRIVGWARVPVPFRVTTTCGQQKSLPWFEHDRLENPFDRKWTLARMFLEIVTFRSLFRSTKASITPEQNLVYGSSKYLWAAAIVFHYCFALVLIRHLRFFFDQVPGWLTFLEKLDGMMQVGLPGIYLTSFGLLLGLGYLLLRRLLIAQVRFMSLPADYFALFLLLGITISGGLLRYTPLRVDLVAVKELVASFWTFRPVAIEGASPMFYIHLFLVSVLLAYFPYSKLMHSGGVFFSPTRNLPNNNRAERHVNPWADELPNKTHSYAAWEKEFAEPMRAAGFELDMDKK